MLTKIYERITDFLWRYLNPRSWRYAWRHRNHHILDLRNPHYKGGWCDRDYLMLYACFKLLQDFIEKERPFDTIDYSQSDHPETADELKALYDWWMNRHYDDIDLLDKPYQEDSEMLDRLMKIRSHLWT